MQTVQRILILEIMSLSTKHLGEDITRDQLELLKAKFDVLQGERKVSLFFFNSSTLFRCSFLSSNSYI